MMSFSNLLQVLAVLWCVGAQCMAQGCQLDSSWTAVFPNAEPPSRIVFWGDDLSGDSLDDIYLITMDSIKVLEGISGSVVSDVTITLPSFVEFISARPTDDWNGDGIDEFLVHRRTAALSSPAQRIDVVDPVTGSSIIDLSEATLPDGSTFVISKYQELDDLDGDGRREWVVSGQQVSPTATEGVVAIISPITGMSMFHWFGGVQGRLFGIELLSLNDMDGDGVRDFVVGQNFAVGPGGPIAGTSEVWASSGGWHFANATALPAFNVTHTYRQIHDFDGDGLDDYAYGLVTGDIALVSSGTGQTIGQILNPPSPNGGFGMEFRGLGDFDGDSVADIVVGAPFFDVGGFSIGKFYIYSGHDLSLIGADSGSVPNFFFGLSFAISQDANGDGYADIVLPVAGTSFGVGSGYVNAYFGRPGFDTSYRDGTVVAADGSLGIDVLGFTSFGVSQPNFGGPARTVEISQTDFSTVWLSKPPAAVGLSRHVIFARIGPELVTPPYRLPGNLGEMGFAPALLSSDPELLTLTDSFTPPLGLLPSTLATPAPGFPICTLPPLPVGLVFTLQGIVEDPASSTFGLAITNSIRVIVGP